MGITLGTRLFTWLRGELVGTDGFGNRYYREKGRRAPKRGAGMDSRERRWVIYKGEPEASRVPPEWHGWLHHTFDDVPRDAGKKKYPWQQDYVPNLTGTADAYRPAGSLLRGGHRARTPSADYEPWRPE